MSSSSPFQSTSTNSSRKSLWDEAVLRASRAKQGQGQGQRQHPNVMTQASPSQIHPLRSPSTPMQQAEHARKEWRRHGSGLSQLSEEKRRKQQHTDTVVRIIAAEPRQDLSGSTFTAYLISILRPGTTTPMIVEHRYSEFAKLHALLRKHSVPLYAGFPSKHWAGRLGNWTPSLTWAPSQHEELIHYRKTQLDLWLVDLVSKYNHNLLPSEIHAEVQEFLDSTTKPPAERENDLDLDTPIEQSLRWSNPLSFTLGSSIRQAAYTVQHMCLRGLSESDQSIPLDLLRYAKGLCFLTVVKGGLMVSGKMGTGLVVARRSDNTWSAPSALGTVGLGWGAQIGGDITHYLVVLTSMHAVEALYHDSSITLGAEFGVAVGPVGRGATSHISSSSLLQPAYAYAHSHGLFVGISLEGSVLRTRHDVNTKFYGRSMEVRDLLSYREPPRAAAPLYHVLDQAMSVSIPSDGFRPSQFLEKQHTPVKLDRNPSTNFQNQQQDGPHYYNNPPTMVSSPPTFGNGMMSPTTGYTTPVLTSSNGSFDQQHQVAPPGNQLFG